MSWFSLAPARATSPISHTRSPVHCRERRGRVPGSRIPPRRHIDADVQLAQIVSAVLRNGSARICRIPESFAHDRATTVSGTPGVAFRHMFRGSRKSTWKHIRLPVVVRPGVCGSYPFHGNPVIAVRVLRRPGNCLIRHRRICAPPSPTPFPNRPDTGIISPARSKKPTPWEVSLWPARRWCILRGRSHGVGVGRNSHSRKHDDRFRLNSEPFSRGGNRYRSDSTDLPGSCFAVRQPSSGA
jgi:hypothetical protein